jgi:acetyl-CoA C-acetyltransferase
MRLAIRRAATDAGLSCIPNPDSIRVVSLLSWRYGDPAFVLAEQLGLTPRETAMSTMGGNSPQSLVNHTAAQIQRGELDLAILAGAESTRTKAQARKHGIDLHWPKAPEGQIPVMIGEEMAMSHPEEISRGLLMPVQIYPMFETAIRAAAGRTVAEQQRVASELWARMSDVAAHNSDAWSRKAKTAEEIGTVGPNNRMIGFPYPKLMNSNQNVDMGAALIMCSVAKAEALGVPRDRWVFIHAGTDCHEHNFVSHRDSFARTPAVEVGGRTALELAGLGIDEISIIDLYSCFPSAVQLGAQSLGLSLDRQLTRTGGLQFAGGPWNNYVMHAIATVMDDVRAAPEETGLVWANGGYLTKHSFGIYRAEPPANGFQYAYPQAEIDALPRRELASVEAAAGRCTIEAYSVMHSREGQPEQAFVACLLDDGRRAWGTSNEPAVAKEMCESEWVGQTATLDSAGDITPS